MTSKALNYKEIVDRIFSLYEGKTQAEIGMVVGKSNHLVGKWGIKSNPTLDDLMKIAKHKGCSLDWLISGDGDTQSQDKVLKAHLPPDTLCGMIDFDPIDIVFSLQKSLAGFQLLLAEAGRYVSVGRSLKNYNDLPGLLKTIRGVKDLCESVSKRLESYRQDDGNHGHSA